MTADRRSEEIEDVPASVLATQALRSRKRQIEGIEDISRTVPGVSFGSGGNLRMDIITHASLTSVVPNVGATTTGPSHGSCNVTDPAFLYPSYAPILGVQFQGSPVAT